MAESDDDLLFILLMPNLCSFVFHSHLNSYELPMHCCEKKKMTLILILTETLNLGSK